MAWAQRAREEAGVVAGGLAAGAECRVAVGGDADSAGGIVQHNEAHVFFSVVIIGDDLTS